MRNLKKLLALVLAFMMTMSLMVTANAATARPKDFNDLDDTSFAEAINVLSALGVVEGYEDGAFQPKSDITRAEVCTMIYRIVTGDVSGKQLGIYADYGMFDDVPANQWYAGAINFCANAEIVKGDGDGTFRPNANITGYEILAMVLRTIGYGQNAEFESSGWQIRTASTAKLQGITANISEGTLGQNSPREMVAEIIFRALQTPTVTYKPYIGYDKNVLVENTEDNRNVNYYNYVRNGGTLPIYSDLMYEKFQIVGQNGVIGRDVYGRPFHTWVKDDGGDRSVTTYVNATEVVNGTYTDENGVEWTIDTTTTTNGRVALGNAERYIPDGDDVAALEIPLAPVKTYYVEKTECDVAKEVNSDETLENVSEWLNGVQAVYDTTSGNLLVRDLDALHTTVDTIGAQGRTTEIYNISDPADGSDWTIVYIDTLLGVVENITPRTLDTNEHVYQQAVMDIRINKDVVVKEYSTEHDFEMFEEGQEVLVNTWGQDGDTTTSNYFNATTNACDDLKAVPQTANDFKVAGDWTVETVGTPETQDITVKGTVGKAEDKTGLISTEDSTTYLSSNVFHWETGVIATPAYPANKGTYVPAGYCDKLTNSLMNRNVTLYLHVAEDGTTSVVGMTQAGASSGIGVITALEPVRVGVGNWVMEATVFKADNTTETLKLLTWENGGWSFIQSNDGGVNVKDATDNTNAAKWNRLIQWTPVVVNGQTYSGVTAVGVPEEDNTDLKNDNGQAVSGILVQAGVADTLRTATQITSGSVNNGTDFIFAGTTFDYSLMDGQNTGRLVLGSMAGYTGFKTIPTVYGNKGDAIVQKVGGTYYVYPKLDNNGTGTDGTNNDVASIAAGVQYNYVAQPGIVTDTTYLVLATVATYPDHATYKVLENGKETTLDVANINDSAAGGVGLNALIEQAMANHELIRVTGRNVNMYATSVTLVDQDYNLGRCDATSVGSSANTLGNLTLLKDSVIDSSKKTSVIPVESVVNVAIGGGVMTLSDATGVAPDQYLTLDEDCQVQIVNLSTGKYYPGTLKSVEQYRTPATAGDESTSHELVYELNAYGYVCNIYIID